MSRDDESSHNRTRDTHHRGDNPAGGPPQGHRAHKSGPREGHRLELLEATDRLLGLKPLPDLTVHDIAAESKFSVGYVYKLFQSKDQIIAAFLREKLCAFRTVIVESSAPPGSWDELILRLLNAMSSWLDRTPAYPSEVTLHLKAFARTHPGVAAELAAFQEFYRNATDSIFLAPILNGHLQEEEPGEIGRTFRALVAGFMEETLMHQDHEGTLADQARLIVRVLERTFSSQGGDP